MEGQGIGCRIDIMKQASTEVETKYDVVEVWVKNWILAAKQDIRTVRHRGRMKRQC